VQTINDRRQSNIRGAMISVTRITGERIFCRFYSIPNRVVCWYRYDFRGYYYIWFSFSPELLYSVTSVGCICFNVLPEYI